MAETLGAKFTIDINNLKAGLNTANKLIRESQSEFKTAAAGLDNWQKSETGLSAKIKSLNQIIPVQEQKVKALKDQYQKLISNGLDPTSNRAIELRTQINREEAALESNKKELKDQQSALKNLQNASEDAGDAIEDVGDQAERSSGEFTIMKGALANLVAEGFKMAISAAKDFAKAIVNVGKTFDSSMSQVAAVSGATAAEVEQLRAKAKELGSTTKFTASEAADAFNYMAMAGWKTEDMLGGIDGILNLAAASGADLATTSDIVTDALTAMGYSAKEAGRLADVMAAASSNANTNVEMMGMTFQYAAPIVGALGYSMEDTAVAIGLMANAGIKGEKSGTALRSILTRLSAPPADCADAMDKLRLSITNTDGTMKTLDEIMGDLRKSFDGLSETEQTAYAKAIAGQEAMSGLLAIVNAAPEDFDKLTKAVEKSNGAADKMASTMMDNLGGDMTTLKSQIEGVQLTLYEKFEPTLRNAVKSAQKWISKVDWKAFGDKALKAFNSIIKVGKQFAKNVLPTVKNALTLLGKAVSWVIDNFEWLSKTVLIAVTAFKALKAVMAVTTAITAAKTAIAGLTAGVGLATKAQAGWNAVMAANPIGAVITAVALLAGGIALLTSNTKDSQKQESEWEKSLNETRDKINENRDSWKELMDAQQEAVNSGMSQMGYYESLYDELKSITDENGKVQEGYEKRAKFIVDTLADALGIEIELVDGQIQKYGELETAIDDVINKKKAQIMLDAQTPAYEEALNKQNGAFQTRIDLQKEINDLDQKYLDAQKELSEAGSKMSTLSGDALKEYKNYIKDLTGFIENWNGEGYTSLRGKLETEYKKNEDLVQNYTYTISKYEKNMALAHEGEWQKMESVNWEYVKDFENVGEAKRAELEAQIAVEKEKLDYMRDQRDQNNTDMYDDQIAAGEKRLEALKDNLAMYVSATETELENEKVVWSDSLAANLSEITSKNIEFKNAGEGLVQMFVDGEKAGAPKSKEEMAQIATDAVAQITAKEKDAETAGKNLIDGINNGISNEQKQNGVFAKIASFGSRLLAKFKASLEEKSPSKATRKMGNFLVEGLGLGIQDKEKTALKQISRFGKNAVRSMRDQVKGVQSAYDLSGLNSGIKAGMNANGGTVNNNSKTVTVNQYNTYSNPHSRYELYKSKQQTAAAVRLALGTV